MARGHVESRGREFEKVVPILFVAVVIFLCYGVFKFKGRLESVEAAIVVYVIFLLIKTFWLIPKITEYNYIIAGFDEDEIPRVKRFIPFVQVILNFNTVSQILYIVLGIIDLILIVCIFTKPILIIHMFGMSGAKSYIDFIVKAAMVVTFLFWINLGVGYAIISKNFDKARRVAFQTHATPGASSFIIFLTTFVPILIDSIGLYFLNNTGMRIVKFRGYNKDMELEDKYMERAEDDRRVIDEEDMYDDDDYYEERRKTRPSRYRDRYLDDEDEDDDDYRKPPSRNKKSKYR